MNLLEPGYNDGDINDITGYNIIIIVIFLEMDQHGQFIDQL